MFIRGLIFVAALTALPAQLVVAGTRDPDVADTKYQEFGAQFPFVLRIRVYKNLEDDKKLFATGSAVAIRPHWVLTAAHVLEHGVDGGSIYKTAENKDGWLIDRFVVHKDFKDELVGWHDIALCRLQHDLGLEFYPGLYARNDEPGQPITLAGWGATGTFSTGFTHFDDKRRAGSNKIDGIDRGVLVCSPEKAHKTALEFLFCPGDSGGGVFIGNDLAGIVSFITGPKENGAPKARYGDTGSSTRISLYRDWIHATIDRTDEEKKP
jgi:hypothetical protein